MICSFLSMDPESLQHGSVGLRESAVLTPLLHLHHYLQKATPLHQIPATDGG